MRWPGRGWIRPNSGDADYMGNAPEVKGNAAFLGPEEVDSNQKDSRNSILQMREIEQLIMTRVMLGLGVRISTWSYSMGWDRGNFIDPLEG